jgi:hypothetical protein
MLRSGRMPTPARRLEVLFINKSIFKARFSLCLKAQKMLAFPSEQSERLHLLLKAYIYSHPPQKNKK